LWCHACPLSISAAKAAKPAPRMIVTPNNKNLNSLSNGLDAIAAVAIDVVITSPAFLAKLPLFISKPLVPTVLRILQFFYTNIRAFDGYLQMTMIQPLTTT